MKEERFPHTRKPLCGQRLQVAEGEALEPQRRAQQQGCGGQSGEIPAQKIDPLIGSNTVIVGYFNTPLSPMDR